MLTSIGGKVVEAYDEGKTGTGDHTWDSPGGLISSPG